MIKKNKIELFMEFVSQICDGRKYRNYRELVEISFLEIFTKIKWKLWNWELIEDALSIKHF
jgi:hypothetical protein